MVGRSRNVSDSRTSLGRGGLPFTSSLEWEGRTSYPPCWSGSCAIRFAVSLYDYPGTEAPVKNLLCARLAE